VPPEYGAGGTASAHGRYASAFEVGTQETESQTPEQWARLTFEGAPVLLRWFVVSGWRFVLGLRLARPPSDSDVLGWQIVESASHAVTLAARSRLLSARNIVRCQQQRITWITVVDFDRRAGRVLWSVAAPIHHATIPFLMQRAIRRNAGESTAR
jgi:hypothetical protein